MNLYRNTQDTDVFVPQRTQPKTVLQDRVVHEPKVSSRLKDDIILGSLVLLSFGFIIGVFAFI